MMVPGAKANDIDAAGREIMMKNSFGLSMAALLGRLDKGAAFMRKTPETRIINHLHLHIYIVLFAGIYLSVRPSIYLSFYLSIYPSILFSS